MESAGGGLGGGIQPCPLPTPALITMCEGHGWKVSVQLTVGTCLSNQLTSPLLGTLCSEARASGPDPVGQWHPQLLAPQWEMRALGPFGTRPCKAHRA